MSSALPAPKTHTLLRLGVVAGWLLFTLMVIAISWTGSLIRGRPADLGGTFLWNSGWLLWAGGTFVVARLARRIPLERSNLPRGLATHAGLGVAVGVAILLLEFLLGHALAAVWPGAPRPNAFLGFIVYKFHVYFLIYWMILGATRAYDFYARFRESELLASQLEARLAQAQLHALKAQLHPHFLFNTHHAIISLMLKSDNAAAIRMLTRLSDLLRLTLRKSDQQVTSLREELDALELYLGIQRERYRDRLEVQLDIEPEALSAEVPWLLLQPLAENALQHGIDARAEGGQVRVTARVREGRLELCVADNGPGFPRAGGATASQGIGLRNTQARLARLYPTDHRFELRCAPQGGAEVHIALPFRPHRPDSPNLADSAAPAHA